MRSVEEELLPGPVAKLAPVQGPVAKLAPVQGPVAKLAPAQELLPELEKVAQHPQERVEVPHFQERASVEQWVAPRRAVPRSHAAHHAGSRDLSAARSAATPTVIRATANVREMSCSPTTIAGFGAISGAKLSPGTLGS